MLAALQAMDLPQQVIAAHKPLTWDPVITVEAAHSLINPLPTVPTNRQFLRTLQHTFLADMSRRQIFCSAPAIPCPATKPNAQPASQSSRPSAPRDHPKAHPKSNRDRRDKKRRTHSAAKAAKPQTNPRNSRQLDDARA